MEPRSAERGNVVVAARKRSSGVCFNGATLSRTWKLVRRGWWRCGSLGFNGATLSRTWKLSRSAGGRSGSDCFNGATLSRTWKRDYMETFLVRRHGCFNGATLSRTWKPTRLRQRRSLRPGAASMEPRSAERGNEKNEKFVKERLEASMEPRSAERGNALFVAALFVAALLQWSHAQPNVETQSRRASRREAIELQWSHAQPNVET